MSEPVQNAEKCLDTAIKELQQCDEELKQALDRVALIWKTRSALLGQFAAARREVIAERSRREEYIRSIELQAEYHERSVGTIPVDECVSALTAQTPIMPCVNQFAEVGRNDVEECIARMDAAEKNLRESHERLTDKINRRAGLSEVLIG